MLLYGTLLVSYSRRCDRDYSCDSALRYALCQNGSLLSKSLKQKRAFRMRDCFVAERAKEAWRVESSRVRVTRGIAQV
jgi:hypothetical protein